MMFVIVTYLAANVWVAHLAILILVAIANFNIVNGLALLRTKCVSKKNYVYIAVLSILHREAWCCI